MPTYAYHCANCKSTRDVILSIKSLDMHQEKCHHCWQLMQRKVTGGRGFLMRSPFEKGNFEHASWDGEKFRDKGHMKDFCEEHDLRSAYLEDGDVP